MRVKELKELLNKFKDKDIVVVEVHDTVLYEDLYEFELDNVDCMGLSEARTEVRICPINHTEAYVKGFSEDD